MTDPTASKARTVSASLNAPIQRRMVRLRPTKGLGHRFPAMHLVRSSWFARLLARITAVLLLGFVVAGILLPWQQTSICEGDVVARLPQLRRQVVTSTAKGVVSKMKTDLREGDKVDKGEVILELEAFSQNQLEQTSIQKRTLEIKLASNEQILLNLINQVATDTENLKRFLLAFEAEVKAATAKWRQSQAEAEGQKSVHDQANRELVVSAKLRGAFDPEIKYQQAFNKEEAEFQKLEKARSAVVEAFEEMTSKEESLASKKSEVDTKIIELSSKVEKQKSEITIIQKDQQDVLVKIDELGRLIIVSPSDGLIQAIQVQMGTNTVKEGDPLFEVIPNTSDLVVELNVRGLDQPLIHVGDEVRLQFDGWPAIQFIGWPSVAIGTFGGRVITKSPSDDSKGNFKIIVAPDPKQETWPDSRYLRQGVRAKGWVILQTVPLGFEVWRQINGFPATRDDKTPSEEKEKDPKVPKFK